MRLYDYFRSSGAYRVRLALNMKGLEYESKVIHLSNNEQFAPEFAARNPQSLIPVLVDGEITLTQSMAIIEYLEEVYPHPPLLPESALARARVRSLALAVACDVHPLNNLRVLRYLSGPLKLDEPTKLTWYQHWVTVGLTALEERLGRESDTGQFCHGDSAGLADVFLIPQLANARRYKVGLAAFPTLTRIEANCMRLDAFLRAAPEAQADAE